MFGFAHNGHRALTDQRDGHRVGAHAVARDAEGGVGRSIEDSEEQLVSEPESVAGRRCEICQALVPANPADEQLGEINGHPCSLIEHRWSAHGIVGVTRCAHCAISMRTDSLANHLSLEHNLPPPSDAQRAQYDAERRIRDEITELGEKITKAVKESAPKVDKLDKLIRELRRLPAALFWMIVTAVIVAELLVPVVKALIVLALESIGTRLR